MKQKYHPYKDWEDYKAGMWRKLPASEEPTMLDEAIRFTGNAAEYGVWMMKVAQSWEKACEHNLSDTSQNRRAWIGHAAACLAIKAPEYLTRQAWGFLNQKQQDDANAEADKAIAWWENHRDTDYGEQLF